MFNRNDLPYPPINESKLALEDEMFGGDTYRSIGGDFGDAPVTRSMGDCSGVYQSSPAPSGKDSWTDSWETVNPRQPLDFSKNQKGSSWESSPFESANAYKLSDFPLSPDSFVLPLLDASAARPLKPSPVYFEKYSSFVSCSVSEILLGDMVSVMSSCGVDHEFILEKNKVRGYCRDGTSRARFCVKVYSHGDEELLVEFQRRDGCVVTFNNFYRRVLTGLRKHFVRRATSAKGTVEKLDQFMNVSQSPSALPLPKMDEEDESDTSVRELCTKLCEEAMCEFVDLQRQALCALANISSDESNQCALNVAECVSVLSAAMQSQDDVVLEHACMLLVNLCSQEHCRKEVVEKLLMSLFFVLDLPGSLENRASKRHIAEAFVLLSSLPQHASLIKEVVNSSDVQYLDKLKKYSDYHDNSLQHNISTALRQIEA